LDEKNKNELTVGGEEDGYLTALRHTLELGKEEKHTPDRAKGELVKKNGQGV